MWRSSVALVVSGVPEFLSNKLCSFDAGVLNMTKDVRLNHLNYPTPVAGTPAQKFKLREVQHTDCTFSGIIRCASGWMNWGTWGHASLEIWVNGFDEHLKLQALSVYNGIKITEKEVDNALLSFVGLQQVCQGSGTWDAGPKHIYDSCCFKPHFGLVCDRNWKQRLLAMRLWGTTALCFFAILFLSLAPPTHARTAPSTDLSTQAEELGIAQPLRDGDSTSLHSAVAEKALNPTIKVITESYLLFLSGEILTWNSLLQSYKQGLHNCLRKGGLSGMMMFPLYLSRLNLVNLQIWSPGIVKVHTDKEYWWTERGRMMELHGTGAKNNLHISWFSSFKVSFLFQYEMLLV